MAQQSYGSITIVDTTDIKKIRNYYLATSYSSGVTTSNGAWGNWVADDSGNPIPSMTATNQYLWNYEVVLGTGIGQDVVINTTQPTIIGRYGQNGSPGKGITSINEYYQVTNSTTAPNIPGNTGEWKTSPDNTSVNSRYLWNYQVINYTTGESYTTNARIIGTHGETGPNGVAGGRWYSGTIMTYTDSNSHVYSNSGITSAVVGDMYLNTSSYGTYQCTIAGNAATAQWKYVNNIKGSTGIGVSAIVSQYCLKATKPASNDSGWQTSPAPYEDGKSYWRRDVIRWTDNNVTTTEIVEDKALTNANAKAVNALAVANYVNDAVEETNKLVDYLDQTTYGTITYQYTHNGTVETVYKRQDGTYYYLSNGVEQTVLEENLDIIQGTGELITNREQDGLNHTVDIINQNAETARINAENAQSSAERASQSASLASKSATLAYNQLSEIEKVVDVLQWAAQHGKYELSTDTQIQSGLNYFTRTGGSGTEADPYKYSVVANPTGNPSTQGYYVLTGVDKAISTYVTTHLALTNQGLILQQDEKGSARIKITATGIHLIDANNNTIAQYTSEVTLGQTNGVHIVLSPSSGLSFREGENTIAWITQNTLHIQEAQLEDNLRIGNFLWRTQGSNRISLVYSPKTEASN